MGRYNARRHCRSVWHRMQAVRRHTVLAEVPETQERASTARQFAWLCVGAHVLSIPPPPACLTNSLMSKPALNLPLAPVTTIAFTSARECASRSRSNRPLSTAGQTRSQRASKLHRLPAGCAVTTLGQQTADSPKTFLPCTRKEPRTQKEAPPAAQNSVPQPAAPARGSLTRCARLRGAARSRAGSVGRR